MHNSAKEVLKLLQLMYSISKDIKTGKNMVN